MFGQLLLKDIHDHLKTFRFSAALITTFVLVTVSVWVLGGDYFVKASEFNRMSEQFAESNNEVYVPSQISPVVLRPITPLSIFAQGADSHLGNAVQIHRWEVPIQADDFLTVNTLMHSIPPFDLMTIFIFAVSLFGILLSYDAISGERENGTLRFLCSGPIKRGVIFASKYTAGIIVLAIPFLFSFVGALMVLQFVHGISFTGEQWLSLVLMAVCGLLYGAAFIALGLLCSTMASRSSVALALALLVWTLTVILLPSAGNGVASMLLPLKSEQEISTLVQQTSSEIRGKMAKFIEENEINLSSYGSSGVGSESCYWFDGYRPWLIDHMRFIEYYEGLYQERAELVWNLQKQHIARKREQYSLGEAIKMLSPAHLLRKSVTALSSTDYATHDEFISHCRRYRQAILDDLRSKGLFDSNIHRFFTRYEMSDFASDEQFEARLADWERRSAAGDEMAGRIEGFGPLPKNYYPAFGYRGSRPDIATAIWPASLLAVATLMIIAVGFAAFLRYDVR